MDPPNIRCLLDVLGDALRTHGQEPETQKDSETPVNLKIATSTGEQPREEHAHGGNETCCVEYDRVSKSNLRDP